MPRKGITGHDEWVVTEALATALIALEQLPLQHQPRPHMDDIRKLLGAGCEPETVALNLAQAKCRLFPDLDRPTIYREYGDHDDVDLAARHVRARKRASRIAYSRHANIALPT